MGLEIERRFLIRPRALPRLKPGWRIEQAFLSFFPVVRVRLLRPEAGGPPRAVLTVKGRGLRARPEFEYRIPPEEARQLFRLRSGFIIRKIRRRVGRWELDRYQGRHAGLWVAEIELRKVGEPLPKPLPPWLGREVTGDPRYTNARLARLARWPRRGMA